jgi:flagellar assembly protein FliH
MLSKILRGAASPAVTRLNWPPAGGAGAAPRGNPSGGGAPAGEAGAGAREIAALKEQMERRVGEARQAGYGEGLTAGRAQAVAEMQPTVEKLAHAIQEIAGLRPRLMREAQSELLELSLAIARRVLHRELSVDPGAVDGLVGSALDKLASQEICRVRVHPELEPAVRRALAREGRGGLALIADSTLERGALLVETARGKLDASLDTQLAEIGRGLADRLPER